MFRLALSIPPAMERIRCTTSSIVLPSDMNASESSPISSLEAASSPMSSALRSRSAMRRATSASRATGRTMRRSRQKPRPTAVRSATRPRSPLLQVCTRSKTVEMFDSDSSMKSAPSAAAVGAVPAPSRCSAPRTSGDHRDTSSPSMSTTIGSPGLASSARRMRSVARTEPISLSSFEAMTRPVVSTMRMRSSSGRRRDTSRTKVARALASPSRPPRDSSLPRPDESERASSPPTFVIAARVNARRMNMEATAPPAIAMATAKLTCTERWARRGLLT